VPPNAKRRQTLDIQTVSAAVGIESDGSSPRHVIDELTNSQPEIVGRFFTSLMNNIDQPFRGATN
jgi:hypothetical protein